MKQSVIVYGPQGCGKTRNAERIRKHLGLMETVDAFKCRGGFVFPMYDTLVLIASNEPVAVRGHVCMSFAEVAQQINDAIPLTDWFAPEAKPEHRGVYKTREPDDASEWFNRWDGEIWHFGFQSQGEAATYFKPLPERLMGGWRGLAEEPIVVKA